MKVLSLLDLKEKGIRFSRQHIHRLVHAGKFPKPIRLGEATVAWLETEIDDWLQARADERRQSAGAV